MAMQIRIGGVKATILNIRNVNISMKRAAKGAINGAGKALLVKVKRHMRLQDHSPDALAKADHPYARRHGSIRIHTGSLKFLSRGENRVHTQTGDLLNALSGQFKPGTNPSYLVSLDVNKAPHARYVIQGTRVMLRRDVIWDTATTPGTQIAMIKGIIKALGKELRTQATVRFELTGAEDAI